MTKLEMLSDPHKAITSLFSKTMSFIKKSLAQRKGAFIFTSGCFGGVINYSRELTPKVS
jgi:hypothetical protein